MLANIKFKFIEELKMLRAEEQLIRNDDQFYDEGGKFIPYSTVIHTEQEHKILMGIYNLRRINQLHDAQKLFDMIQKINRENDS